MAFVEPATAVGQDEFSASVVPVCRLGTRAMTRDGRVFRYAHAGAADLVAGTLVQSAVAFQVNIAGPTAPVGATSFLVPFTTPGAANYFADGYFLCPGNGSTHVISNHATIAVASFRLTLETPLVVANPTPVTLMAHPFKHLIIANVAVTAASVVGVATSLIPAGQYGWVLTWGVASLLCNGAGSHGYPVMASISIPGAVEVQPSTVPPYAQIVGTAMEAFVTATKAAIFVKLGA